MPRTLVVIILLGITQLLSAADTLKVGLAEVDVTPTISDQTPVYVAGFGMNRRANKVHDPIMARAIVLDDGTSKIALVSVDVVGLFHEFVLDVRKQLKGYTYVGVSATHNHEGPDTLGLWGSSPFKSGVDPAYMRILNEKIVKVIQQAEANLQPARCQIGKKAAPELLTDNREPYIKHDDLYVLQFLGKTDKPIGLMVQWNCHPETMASKNTELTADYVGYTVTALQKKYGCPVVYFTGTVGGLLTSLDVPIKNKQGVELKDGTWEKTELFGLAVADVAMKAVESAEPVTLTPLLARSKKVLVPVENELYKLGWRVGVLKRQMFVWKKTTSIENAEISKNLTNPAAVKTEVGYLKLGDVEIAVIPGEIYPELVLGKVQDPADANADFPTAPIEPSIFGQLKSKHRLLIGLGNDEIGYLIPKCQWDKAAPYCYNRKKDQYGEENSVGPDAAGIIAQTFADLVQGK
ncbi:MAG: neutral/alkaline non-lysosomal ceramidase N-terminal domain-containing protein [Zavarzinella sp.]